ncbi:hypothetical protein J7E29_12305 [Streptomyces sp. ISL-90]|nr:hypothetical protein [Streptomyces sp. ISL-90]
MPDVSDIAPDDEQKVLWQLEWQRPHHLAELDREAAQFALVDLPHLGEAHPPETREQLGHRPCVTVSPVIRSTHHRADSTRMH